LSVRSTALGYFTSSSVGPPTRGTSPTGSICLTERLMITLRTPSSVGGTRPIWTSDSLYIFRTISFINKFEECLTRRSVSSTTCPSKVPLLAFRQGPQVHRHHLYHHWNSLRPDDVHTGLRLFQQKYLWT
jgi:hypothetical protein